jgi:hypothetical protein
MRKRSQLRETVMRRMTILRQIIRYRCSRSRTTSKTRMTTMKRAMTMRILMKRMEASLMSMKSRMTTMRRPMKMKWMTSMEVYSSGSREGAPPELAMTLSTCMSTNLIGIFTTQSFTGSIGVGLRESGKVVKLTGHKRRLRSREFLGISEATGLTQPQLKHQKEIIMAYSMVSELQVVKDRGKTYKMIVSKKA